VVRLNDLSWNLGETNVWSNTGTNRFLPSGVDFSTAKITGRKGRDLATLWRTRAHFGFSSPTIPTVRMFTNWRFRSDRNRPAVAAKFLTGAIQTTKYTDHTKTGAPVLSTLRSRCYGGRAQ
jgi:hypothetical protein